MKLDVSTHLEVALSEKINAIDERMLASWQTQECFDFGIKLEQPEWRRRVSVHSTFEVPGNNAWAT